MTDVQAPQRPPAVNEQRRHEGPTSLVGEFQFDLPLHDSATVCTRAIKGLGWPIKAVTNHIVSYADTASTQHPLRIEVELHDSGQTTGVRITGTDSDDGLQRDALIGELDRVRDAIKAETEAMEDSAQAPLADWSSHPERKSPLAHQTPPPVNDRLEAEQEFLAVSPQANAPLHLCPPTADICPYCGSLNIHSRRERSNHRLARMLRRGKGVLIGLIVLLLLGGAGAGAAWKIQHDNNVAAKQRAAKQAAAHAKQRQAAPARPSATASSN